MNTAQPQPDPVEGILIAAARQDLSSSLLARLQHLLSGEVDWDRLTSEAWRHGVAGLLYRHFSSDALAPLVPAPCRAVLRGYYVRSAFRQRTHSAAIDGMLGAFGLCGVPVILLKGAALTRTTYRDLALRPYADIDLLISDHDVAAAKDAMGRCGYGLDPVLLSEKISRRFHSNLPFVKNGGPPVHVELHWSLSDRFGAYEIPADDFRARAVMIEAGGSPARVLELHDSIVYLAAHLDKHGYLNQAIASAEGDTASRVLDELSGNRLIWVTDLHELISSRPVDWRVLAQRAGTGELREAVASALLLLHRLFGTAVDPGLRPGAPHWAQRATNRMVLAASSSPGRRRFFQRHILRTRRGFEVRLIRLVGLGSCLFPRSSESLARRAVHAARATARGLHLAAALAGARLTCFRRGGRAS